MQTRRFVVTEVWWQVKGYLGFRHHWWRRPVEGKGKAKGRPAARPILSPNVPIVRLNNATANRQPQPKAALRARGLPAVEFVKQVLLLAWRDARPVVGHLDRHGVIGHPRRQRSSRVACS